MGWRDLIVTSQTHPNLLTLPMKRHIEDIEDIEPRYTKKSSLSIEKSPQNSIPTKPSPISSKLSSTVQGTSPSLGVPAPPLQPGWLVVYRNHAGSLCGGADDRLHGTVHRCLWGGTAWMLILTDGQRLPLWAITSVGKTDTSGRVVAAWDVRGSGINGEGQRP